MVNKKMYVEAYETLSAIADHISSTGHNIKWDHFHILATGRSD